MGLKLRWFRARMNVSSRSMKTDFSAPSHGLYRPTYSMYGADILSETSRSTRDISQPDVATRLLPKQMSKSMPDLGDTPSSPAMAFAPKVKSPHTQLNASSLHSPHARQEVAAVINPAFAQQDSRTPHQQQNAFSLHNPKAREVAVATNPAFAQQMFDPASQETAKTKNKLQLKLNIPATTEVHKPSKSEAAVNATKPEKKKGKNKLAPSPPKPGNDKKDKKDKKNKKSNKEVVDLRFGGESES
ncbi:hypothetical protein PR048_029889 [Dryococelus australis]|uniref:Uncharacterized protein n=1 Tax=Dryococelus australis TaxID=614101 RepID=A0ABQ9G7E9_9NEOP|nr:hypothetical protein PR048_029889 [Dryococelus australis]